MSSLNSLWEHPTPNTPDSLGPKENELIPKLARTYLSHSIATGTLLASVVRLQMTGQIKLKKWIPFTATQVVRIGSGFVWSARAEMGIGFIKGSDEFIDGVGEMKWKLLGLFPVMSGSGPDISRSAGDRYAMERILLPSAFCQPEVRWTTADGHASVEAPGLSKVTFELSTEGRVKTVSMLRWGNPDGEPFGLIPFGGYVDEESTWTGFTIPSRLRIGWYFGTDRFDEGEFFRVAITKAEFR